MVIQMINWLFGRYEPGLTLDRAALILMEANFPRREIGEHIHNVYDQVQSQMNLLTSGNAAPR